MKKMLFNLLLFLVIYSYYSCSNESFEEIIVTDEISDQDTDSDSETDEYVSDIPCDFDLKDISANSTVVIDCILDLKGETINLPTNVKIEFDGGDIIGDGTLNFNQGTIDGRLLSSKMTVKGDVQLKDSNFEFIPSRWENIVEGQTTSEIALKNTSEIEKLIYLTKSLGADTFTIDKFDAYFEVTKVTPPTTNNFFYPSKEAINIPSNFHLKMSQNSFLRIFPGAMGIENGAIISVEDAINVKITGGSLCGDRDDRQYSPTDEGLEGEHLLYVYSSKNVIIDGVNFLNGSKGSIHIYSKGFPFEPENYKPTSNVTVMNCHFKNSRRMAIALTDGRDITIENNTFLDTAQASTHSDGGEVGFAINIEPVRKREDNGELREYQKVFDVLISDNTEINSRSGFLTITIGQDITVQNNKIDTRIAYSFASDSKIINNNFVASEKSSEHFAIFASGFGETVFNNEISENSIDGYSVGIVVGSIGAYIHDNTIKNGKNGIQLSESYDARVINNKINVSERGISSTNTFASNTEISNNEIRSGGFHLYLVEFNNKNEEQEYILNVKNNTFFDTKKIVISRAKGVHLSNNNVDGALEIGNSSNIIVTENSFTPDESDGIRLYDTNNNIFITKNNISEPTGASRFVCINNDSDASSSAILESENTCL